jgi:hypothetical protein
MTKPHLIKIRGVWHCAARLNQIGLGYTPKCAYESWLELARHYNAEARKLKQEIRNA